jgi:hypothetical protein
MKQAFKLTIARRSINGATIEYFLSSYAAKARIESLESKGYSVTMTKVVSFNNNYCEVL